MLEAAGEGQWSGGHGGRAFAAGEEKGRACCKAGLSWR